MAISASLLTSAVAVVLNYYPECLGGWICVPSLVPRPIQNIGEKSRMGLGMRLLCFPDVAEGSHCDGGVKLLSRMPWRICIWIGVCRMVTNHTYSESTRSTIPTWSLHHADSSRWYSAKHPRLAEPHLQWLLYQGGALSIGDMGEWELPRRLTRLNPPSCIIALYAVLIACNN